MKSTSAMLLKMKNKAMGKHYFSCHHFVHIRVLCTQLQLLLGFLIVCLDLLYGNNVVKNTMKNKEKVFDTNPDMNTLTSHYD